MGLTACTVGTTGTCKRSKKRSRLSPLRWWRLINLPASLPTVHHPLVKTKKMPRDSLFYLVPGNLKKKMKSQGWAILKKSWIPQGHENNFGAVYRAALTVTEYTHRGQMQYLDLKLTADGTLCWVHKKIVQAVIFTLELALKKKSKTWFGERFVPQHVQPFLLTRRPERCERSCSKLFLGRQRV